MEVTVRTIKEPDVPRVLPLWEEMMAFHAAVDPAFAIVPDAASIFSGHLSGMLKNPDFQGLLAESDGNAVGYCLARVAEKPPVFVRRRHGLISDLAVRKICRNSGVGETLFLRAKEWLAEKQVERIELRLLSSNGVSSAFWNKMGFKTFAEERFLSLEP